MIIINEEFFYGSEYKRYGRQIIFIGNSDIHFSWLTRFGEWFIYIKWFKHLLKFKGVSND